MTDSNNNRSNFDWKDNSIEWKEIMKKEARGYEKGDDLGEVQDIGREFVVIGLAIWRIGSRLVLDLVEPTSDLTQLSLGPRPLRIFQRTNRRHDDQRGKDADDRDHDQKLDEREGAISDFGFRISD